MLSALLLTIALVLFINNKFYYSLLIFFLFVTNGFQIIPSAIMLLGLPIEKTTDYGLIYILIICLIHVNSLALIYKLKIQYTWTLPLLAFVLFSAVYSILVLDYEIYGVIKVFRAYIFYLSIIPFFFTPTDTLLKTFKTLTIITLIQSVIFLSQLFIKEPILQSSASGSEAYGKSLNETSNYIRFYNLPAYLNVSLFYFLFLHNYKSNLNKTIVLSILFLTLLAPLHRSYIITMVAILSMYYVVKSSTHIKVVYISAITVFVIFLLSVDIISARMNEGFQDIQNAFKVSSISTIDESQSTFMYRVAHFIERFDYVCNDPKRWFFGVGLLSDNSPEADKLPFQIGLFVEKYNRVSQVDSGDLIWSPLILQLGLFGTLIYIIMMVKYSFYFLENKKIKYWIIGFYTIIEGFLVSFMGTDMLSTTYRVMLLLLIVIMDKQLNPSHVTHYEYHKFYKIK